MNTMVMLFRREFWEHRALWLAPLVWIGVILLIWSWILFFLLSGDDIGRFVDAPSVEQMQELNEEQRAALQEAIQAPEEQKQVVPAIGYLSIYGMLAGFASIVVFFYLIDCLFSERRDRSILFWKSLPVSDTQVVLSKLAVAMVIVPLGIVLLSAVVQLVAFGLWTLRFHGTVVGQVTPDWDLISWLRSQGVALKVVVGGVLWYMPIAAYLMLLSVWARRFVLLWAMLPIPALQALEYIFFRTNQVGEFVGERLFGFVRLMDITKDAFGAHSGESDIPRVQNVFDSLHLSTVLVSPEMWGGLVAAAAMLYVTIRMRRYRDES